MRAGILVALITVAACVEHVQLSPGSALPGLVSLDVTPGTPALSIVDLSAPAQRLAFTATGHFVDGSARDVTQLVQWSTDNPAPGAIDSSGMYAVSNAAGGQVAIRASSGDLSGTARLTVVVSLVIVDGAYPPPSGAEGLFAPGTPILTGDPTHAPAMRYPADDTMFPQALSRTVFQYTAGTSNDVVRLAFDSDVLHLVVLSGGDRWQPDSAIWALIERSHPGGQLVLAVESASSISPGAIYAGAAQMLRFSRSSIDAAIYYWSTATNAVMRGSLDSAVAGKLYPATGDKTCAGCHTISRDGHAMALGYAGETLQSVDLPTLGTTVSAAARIPMGWATFSPNADRILVANKGVLTLYNASSGTPVGAGHGVVPLGNMFATHPDWSPDGSAVVVALTSTAPMNMDLKGGSIARIAYRDGVWGAPEVIVASSTNNDNNYFPKWSPDGSLIAYVHAAGPARGAPTAELRLVSATGGVPITLRLASHRVGGADDVPDLADTMPSWAPANGDVAWLSFASARPYGVIRPTLGTGQIWVAAIDPTRPADPSFAAFWLPAQVVTDLNNNPIWAPTPTSVH